MKRRTIEDLIENHNIYGLLSCFNRSILNFISFSPFFVSDGKFNINIAILCDVLLFIHISFYTIIPVHSERYNEYSRRQVALPQSEGAKTSILMIV